MASVYQHHLDVRRLAAPKGGMPWPKAGRGGAIAVSCTYGSRSIVVFVHAYLPAIQFEVLDVEALAEAVPSRGLDFSRLGAVAGFSKLSARFYGQSVRNGARIVCMPVLN
ncbi:uncharacterized protein FPRO_16115 [Fusarium proliferatum ET1]|uniref:Uncharacterized protein n=1 Tax=Fusarium proliferatum (strain ET1) TaxID=1227346 RepID=A0A1L7WBB4_FUSPR|nr:uncharacterized protein FPRO_16115 [Fusarium proliferatum ET1]CZR49910.1 uncharacterized protein FPRO_16115 [Fusarium proliferatum ET1]